MDGLQIIIPIGLALMMLGVGLTLTLQDFRSLFDSPRAVVVGSFAQIVLLPLVAFLVAWAFGLPGPLAVGLVLIAACPGGPTSNLLSSLANADVALSVVLTSVSGVVTVVTIPLVVNLAAQLFMKSGSDVSLPIWETILQIIAVTILPVVAGMWLRVHRRPLAERLEPIARRASLVLLVVLAAGTFLKERANLADYIAQAGLPVVALNVGTMALGMLIAYGLRLGRARALTIAIEVGMQNAAMALGIALGLLKRPDVAIPAVLYAGLMYVTSGALVWWARRGGAPQARALADSNGS